MTMKMMSLKLWSFCAIVTFGFAAAGCAAESDPPTETGEQVQVVEHRAPGTIERDDEETVAQEHHDVPVLAASPFPDPTLAKAPRSVPRVPAPNPLAR